MKITYGNVLISQGQRDAPDGLVFSTDWAVQVQPLLRSSTIKVFPRSNESNAISFTIRQGFNDARDAHNRVVTLRRTLPRKANLVLKPFGPAGSVGTITVANAAITRFVAGVEGVLAIMTFSFVGEAIS